MQVVLYIPPQVHWFHSIIGNQSKFKTCGDISEFNNYPDHFRIIIDSLEGTDSDIRSRIIEYLPYTDKVIILNSETPINIVAHCRAFDHDKVELLITGKVNYEPKHMKIFRHENFFACVQMLYKRLNYEPLQRLQPFSIKPYYFDALLGLEKPFRNWINDQVDLHCSEKVFKTYYRSRDNLASLNPTYFAWTPEVEILNTPYATSNTISYHGEQTWLSHVIPVDIYNQCAYSIVSETYEDNTFSFYTEKTAKVLMARRLFIMFAGAGYLRNLKELGFKTFDDIIDESYDSEPDHDKRHTMAFEQVKKLCQMDQAAVLSAIEPTVNHNYNLLMSHDWHQEYLDHTISRLAPN